jgi:hypothetical protein
VMAVALGRGAAFEEEICEDGRHLCATRATLPIVYRALDDVVDALGFQQHNQYCMALEREQQNFLRRFDALEA